MDAEFDHYHPGAQKIHPDWQKAHWVSRDTILWPVHGSPDYKYTLYYSPEAVLAQGPDGILGGNMIPLEYVPGGTPEQFRQKYPHLAGLTTLRLPEASLSQVKTALRGQVILIARDPSGWFTEMTGVQIPGVLDDLYTYAGCLGVTYSESVPSISLWAPTARSVSLELYGDATTLDKRSLPMKLDEVSGVWSLTGDASWSYQFYLYALEVYVPMTGRIEKILVTDPYSTSLSTNSLRSQIVDLKAQALKPAGWDRLVKPALAAPEDIVIYELHVRDFSIYDATVPQDLRGTFKAFTVQNSDGMKHLRSLAESGLTHIHLLPVFDIATVNEDKSTWKSVDEAWLSSCAPDSDQQQWQVSAISASDGFNWGYDPYHYTTPEGSYATDPNGALRILEFRQMVQSLSQNGLRVVMDVVYNHTFGGGLDDKAVLDKVVPGYYHRLNWEGKIEQSTCCSNTASEHAMMGKLMRDSIVTWAREYKVDGFRFDLMGHHMLADLLAVRRALDELTLEKDGVDGKAIYMYGEGWNFGEVANNARGVNAVQQNMAGTGIGAFNDRLRDALRGGGAFGNIFEQGFATGLYFQPNAAEWRSLDQQRGKLIETADWIRITLAGSLKKYQFVRANGDRVPAEQVFYNGSPAAFALDPQENIVYAAAHDNETLWDVLQIKLSPAVSLADRVRMNNLVLSLVAFSQGIPFFHAGDDILRSKSLDRNSYNSGDWFNKLDWTYETNNWGVGLPSEGRDKWDIFRPLLANPAIKPGKTEITFASAVFREYLKIRKSSPLFRLRTAEAVQRVVSFLNTGYWQIPGFIVMQLTDSDNLDPRYNAILVLVNASPDPMTFAHDTFVNLKFELHPVQAVSVDEIVKQAEFDIARGAFVVPGRTTAVFVLKHDQPPAL